MHKNLRFIFAKPAGILAGRFLTCVAAAALMAAASSVNAAPFIGGQLFATGGDVIVEVKPATAGYVSELRLYSPGPERLIALNTDVGKVVNLGSFPAGEELIFGIYVRDTGYIFKMGAGSRNPDNLEHAAVETLGSGQAVVGFEDLYLGGDLDYDDNVFLFTGGIAPFNCGSDIVVPTDSGTCAVGQGEGGQSAFFASGGASAVVYYTTPSVAGATVNCVPPSGSSFPVGTNVVTCTANYTRGDVVTCGFQVVVLPGRGAKECVFAQLVALRLTVTDKKDGALLDEATFDDLAESLLPVLWVDQLHLDPKRGSIVFQEVRETAKILCALIRKNKSHLSPDLLRGFINQLLQVDRAIALTAINDAIAAGAPAKNIEKALKALAKGDAEVNGDKCYKAFDFYRDAWKAVVK